MGNTFSADDTYVALGSIHTQVPLFRFWVPLRPLSRSSQVVCGTRPELHENRGGNGHLSGYAIWNFRLDLYPVDDTKFAHIYMGLRRTDKMWVPSQLHTPYLRGYRCHFTWYPSGR